MDGAIAQLDLMIGDPTVGALARTDVEQDGFPGEVSPPSTKSSAPRSTTYRDALRDEVLPSARDDLHPGLCFLPGGDEMYLALARLHTSTTYTPDELHAMGLEIVEQVREELTETGSRLWGTTAAAGIFDRLSNDPALRYRSRQEMLDHAKRAVAAAEAEAPRWFATVPDEPCTVEAVPEIEEAGAAGAYYMPGAIDGSRSGTYFLNTSKPEERHRYAAEDVAFHEAVPGHHFQLTIAMESTDLPAARRMLHDTACAEGWGLYSERLADEMGLYSGDLDRMGSLPPTRGGPAVWSSTPACTQWGGPRQRAVDWFADHTPMPRIEIESEVDRYISYPGQALAYMVGRREIVRLRSWAADALGTRFDLRAFHDLVLRAGILPLPALARTVERWVDARCRRNSAPDRALLPQGGCCCESPGQPSPPTATASYGAPRDEWPSPARAGSTRSTAGRTACSGRPRSLFPMGQVGPGGPPVAGHPARAGQTAGARAYELLAAMRQQVHPGPDRDGHPRAPKYSARVPLRNASHSAARMLFSRRLLPLAHLPLLTPRLRPS